MEFYWSWNKIPELQQRSNKECRQAIWQVGLKPFRHWQVWLALFVASALALIGLESLFWYGFIERFNRPMWGSVLIVTCVLSILASSFVIYRHTYLKFARPFICPVVNSGNDSWLVGMAQRSLISVITFIFFLISMLIVDWLINSFDVNIDQRYNALKTWPTPIPDNENGFVAMVGLMAPFGTSSFVAGQASLTAMNQAAENHATKYPKWPEGLKYSELSTGSRLSNNGQAEKRSSYPHFCKAGSESCWNILHKERSAATAWLRANKEILIRYQSLKKYPRWQYAIQGGDILTPFPSYHVLIRGQNLLQLSAMLEIENGQFSKGLAMIGDDIQFAKMLLSSKDSLIGKMISTALLYRDIAWLAETIQVRPNESKLYWMQISKMLNPLTSEEVSVVDAFKFEEKNMVSYLLTLNANKVSMQSLMGNAESDSMYVALFDKWQLHHFKGNATSNLAIDFYERLSQRLAIDDVNVIRPFTENDEDLHRSLLSFPSFHFNQVGKIINHVAAPAYLEYPNKLLDLNVLNTLLRIRVSIAENRIAINDVPSFLKSSDQSLWNAETGKPFEWDAARKQIFFTPSTDSFKKLDAIGGVSGRIGVAL